MFLYHLMKRAQTLLVTLHQGVQRLHENALRMSHLLREPQEDVASLILTITLQRGKESQVIAPRHTQGMEKGREEDISIREGDLPLLAQTCHLLMIPRSQMHL